MPYTPPGQRIRRAAADPSQALEFPGLSKGYLKSLGTYIIKIFQNSSLYCFSLSFSCLLFLLHLSFLSSPSLSDRQVSGTHTYHCIQNQIPWLSHTCKMATRSPVFSLSHHLAPTAAQQFFILVHHQLSSRRASGPQALVICHLTFLALLAPPTKPYITPSVVRPHQEAGPFPRQETLAWSLTGLWSHYCLQVFYLQIISYTARQAT